MLGGGSATDQVVVPWETAAMTNQVHSTLLGLLLEDTNSEGDTAVCFGALCVRCNFALKSVLFWSKSATAFSFLDNFPSQSSFCSFYKKWKTKQRVAGKFMFFDLPFLATCVRGSSFQLTQSKNAERPHCWINSWQHTSCLMVILTLQSFPKAPRRIYVKWREVRRKCIFLRKSRHYLTTHLKTRIWIDMDVSNCWGFILRLSVCALCFAGSAIYGKKLIHFHPGCVGYHRTQKCENDLQSMKQNSMQNNKRLYLKGTGMLPMIGKFTKASTGQKQKSVSGLGSWVLGFLPPRAHGLR